MSKPDMFLKFMGKERHYHDFVVFFVKEMEKKGWQHVVQEYIFSGDERSEKMLIQMFAGRFPPSSSEMVT